jgi:hypothetical protein
MRRAALAIGCLAVTGCDYNDYPIEATFCDHWCRVMRRSGCEQEPENCIRDCESAKASDRCLPLQSSLLECYESTPADRFECVGQGFQSSVRPRPEICTEERYDLIRCEVPRVMQCVAACVAIDAATPASPEPLDAGPEPPAVSLKRACPQSPFPCERLCWELDARFGRGRPTTLTSIDTADDTDLAAIGEPLIVCAQAGAEACRAQAASATQSTPMQSTPMQSTPMQSVSWTSLFLRCAGLPADVGLLD